MNTALETLPPIDVNKLDTAKPLVEIFQPFQATLAKWEAKVDSLTVTDINQKTEMAQARLARLELKDARVTMDKTRKGLVENLKARTGKIDATARVIREKMEWLEAKLLDSEEFAQRHALKLKGELQLARMLELAPFLDYPFNGDLSELSESDYQAFLSDSKLLRQTKLDAVAKAEADRKAKEEADLAERERVAVENARLKAEAAETAKLADIERKRIDAERAEERRKAQEESARFAEAARKERIEAMAKVNAEYDRLTEIAAKERKRIEEKAKVDAAEAAKARAELAAKAKAEAEEKARIAKELRDAAAAPDKAKLQTLANVIRHLPIPGLQTAGDMEQEIQERIEQLAQWIEAQIARL